jgi:hypothetical protein
MQQPQGQSRGQSEEKPEEAVQDFGILAAFL